jgi:hypothetical protein
LSENNELKKRHHERSHPIFIIVLSACEKEGEGVGVSVSHLHGNYYYGWMDGLRREMRNEWNKSLFVREQQ